MKGVGDGGTSRARGQAGEGLPLPSGLHDEGDSHPQGPLVSVSFRAPDETSGILVFLFLLRYNQHIH